ncbi:MAG: hypothetical protein V3S56_03895, partial [Gemmatimonadota bacterium]
GLALAFSAFSLTASGRSLTAWLAVSAGVITFLLGHRLLRAAAAGGSGARIAVRPTSSTAS